MWSEDTWIPCWWGDAAEGWLLKRTVSQAHLESGKLTLRLVPIQQPPTAPLPLWGECEPLGLAYSSQLIVGCTAEVFGQPMSKKGVCINSAALESRTDRQS